MINYSENESLSARFALSIFNSEALEKAIDSISSYHWHLPQDELARFAIPSESDRRLRRRYWQLVSETAATGSKYTIGKLHLNICTYTHLYNNILSNPYKLGWILKPSFEMKTEIDELQNKMFDSLKQILELPNFRKDGSVDQNNVKLKIKVFPLISKLSGDSF